MQTVAAILDKNCNTNVLVFCKIEVPAVRCALNWDKLVDKELLLSYK